ncbi:MAG: hypothetical protein RIR18_1404 [Pseudomonadota bacterium]
MGNERKFNLWMAAALACVGVDSVCAEEDELYFSQMPTIFSASRMPQAQSETPNFVTVIDRDMIRASGAREVSDLMRLVPGFQVTSRVLEMPARVAYHGLAGEDYSPRLQVLIDGRSQYSGLFRGGVNWDLLPVAIENIERIEVVRGSNVVAYGTNAFMGVVNIITTDPSQTRGTTVSALTGSRGVSDQFVRFGGDVGEATLRLSYQGQADDGIKFIPQKSTDTRSIPNGQQKRLFDLRLDMPLGLSDSLSLNLGKVEGAMQVGRSDATATDPFTGTDKMTNPPRTIHQSTQFAQLSWLRALADGDELRVTLHSTEDRYEDPAVYASDAFPLDQSGRSTRDEIELQHTINMNPALRVMWGMGARQESVGQSYEYFTGGVSRKVQRLFSHAEWRPAQDWLLNVGGSVDKDSYSGEHFSPRASASYRLAEGHTLRAGITQAYRMPTLIELAGNVRYVPEGLSLIQRSAWLSAVPYEYLVNGQVQAEKLISQEIGYLGEYKEWRATLDARIFSEYIPNRVWKVSAPTGGYDYVVNAEDTRITGFEYQLRWQPQEGTRLMLGQSAVQIQSNLGEIATAASDTYLSHLQRQTRNSAPQLTNAAMLMQKLPYDLDLSVMVYQTDTMYWATNKPANAYTRIDWRLAKPFTWGTTRGEVAYVVQSEEGAHAELKPSNMVMPRQWISVRFDL